MQKKFVPLSIFIVLLLLLGVGLTLDPGRIPSPLIDKPAPDDGKTLGSSDFNGDVTLLNVWASWCSGCRTEHPVLLELSKKGVVRIYGLNYKDNRNDAIRWLEYYGDPYVANAHDLDGKVGIDFGVYGIPETFVIDSKGIIRYKHIGPVTESVLNEDILPAIEQTRVNGL